MKQPIALIGAPSSAGAHWPGQEKTPQYLRNAGLVKRLEAAGLNVIDFGDLPSVRFRPDSTHRHQQHLGAVVGVCRRLADPREINTAEHHILTRNKLLAGALIGKAVAMI